MEIYASYIGAALSAIAAVVAWLFNYRLKKYELEQGHLNRILEKRFEVYPKLWHKLGDFTATVNEENFRDKSTELCAEIKQHEIDNGIFYSAEVQSEVEEILNNLDNYLTGNNLLNIPVQNFARSVIKLRMLIKDDLGAYGDIAVSKRNA